jgi:hypothetical protein
MKATYEDYLQKKVMELFHRTSINMIILAKKLFLIVDCILKNKLDLFI